MAWATVDKEYIATLEAIFHVVKKQVPAAIYSKHTNDIIYDGKIGQQKLITF